jgi:hypothetical protein
MSFWTPSFIIETLRKLRWRNYEAQIVRLGILGRLKVSVNPVRENFNKIEIEVRLKSRILNIVC